MVIMEEDTTSMIMAALSTLSPQQLSDLTHSLSSHLRHHRRRLTTLISIPTLFSLTLYHLHSLSLPSKTLLISRYLLSTLRLLTHHLQYPIRQRHPSASAITPQDHDALILLLLLCEVHQHHPTALHCFTSASPSKSWRLILANLYSDYSLLTLSGIVTDGVCSGAVLLQFIEIVTRCWKLVGPVIESCGGGVGKGMEVAASAAAAVSLPSVSVRGGYCVVCKEEMEEGRDVCQLPCQHLFHWICLLPWLRKRSTCPCCRFQLPTDDVFREIQRLWDVLVKVSSTSSGEV